MKGIFFTDIDGTLIDHNTYSFDESVEGVNLLKERGIPLVPVSSKTFDEISALMEELSLSSPFVFENGCGIAYPDGSGYRIEISGSGIEPLRDVVPLIEEYTGLKVIPLANLSAEDICIYTGLSVERSLLSLKRKGSLPFILDGRNLLTDEEINNLKDTVASHGAVLTKGGRFNHLLPAGAGKGEAVRRIIEFYNAGDESTLTGAAGDSINDLSMVRAVDRGYLVRRHDGSLINGGAGLHVTSGIGPQGFTEAVKDYLNNIMV